VAVLAAACRNRPDLAPSKEALKTVSGVATTVRDFEAAVTSNIQKAGVTGLSVAIINDGKVAYTRQFGWKDKDAGTSFDDTTVFAAASLSKTVFAYLVVALAEGGLIDLDRPLQEYLPKSLPEYSRYADLASDPRYRAITARMALSHTTGFPNMRSPTGQLRIGFEPGSRFRYSGEGIQLLQFVVEALAQKNLEALAQERVFIPLGMSHTSYVWRESFARDVAAPHNEFEWASDPDRAASADAAGSMITTAHDYARFLAHIITAEGRRKETVDWMLSWGLGWGLFETRNGRAFFHTGHKGGAQNYVVAYLDRGIGIVLLSNSDNFESVTPEIVAAGIGDRDSPFDWLGYEPYDSTRRKPAPPRRIAVQVPAEVIASYAGEYRFGPNASTFIKADGSRLFASDDRQSWDELFAQSETVFFFKGRTVTLTFVKNAAGTVTGIDVDNQGTKISARRVR
jgi:CubicO group peptidase (beta-lactamase class C family)